MTSKVAKNFMSKKMIVLRYLPDSVSAEVLRSRLEVAGIESHVRGTSAETAFGLGGAPTISGLRIEVADDVLEAAQQVLEDDDRVREVAGDWVCGQCSEQNDATFEICWNCRKERGPGDAKVVADIPVINPVAAPESQVQDRLDGQTSSMDLLKKPNPYQPILIPNDRDGKVPLKPSGVASDEYVDALLKNLYRLSCVSLMLLPIPLVLFTLYQVCSVPEAIKNHPAAPPRLRRYLLFNLTITFLMLLFWLSIAVG